MNRHRQFLERGTIFMLWVIAKRLSSDRGGIPDNITFTRAFIADLPLDLESFRLLAVKESGVHISYEAAQSLLTIQEWVDAIVTVVLNSPCLLYTSPSPRD